MMDSWFLILICWSILPNHYVWKWCFFRGEVVAEAGTEESVVMVDMGEPYTVIYNVVMVDMGEP